jgi:hypothetical protein
MMSNAKCSWFRWSFWGVTLLAAAVCGRPAQGQDAPAVRVGGVDITGIPEDWSHRYVVFSNPGTEQEAIQSGDYAQWQKIVNEPRYVLQQLKKNVPVQGPAAVDTGYRSRWISEADGVRSGLEAPEGDALTIRSGPRPWRPVFWRDRSPSYTEKDWSEALGGPGLAAGQYPAKYSFSTTAASCSDFVVFATGAAGSSTQATIIAFNNIYVGAGGCETSTPTVYWAFNTPPGGTATDSATANLSPVLSLDGKQLAFVENYSGTAYLVILRMAAESSSAYNDPSSAVVYEAPGSYNGCTAPCYTTLSLSTSDTSSAPFYIYSSADTLYVGDDSGKVHEVTGVFNGKPTIDANAGWPVTASTETKHALNSPVYDPTSENLFVGDSGGYLHQFAPSSPGTVNTSNRLENNTVGVFDPPLIDSTTEEVYAFVGYSGDTSNPSNSSYMNRFAAGSSIAGSYGTGLDFKNGGANNPSTSIMRAGAFDNQYFASSEASGNLYVCENGVLYQVPLPAFSAANTFNTAVSAIGSMSTCSPVTEFLGVKASTTINEAGGISAAATSVTVASGTGFVNGDYIQVDSEIMQVTAGGGTTNLTISRGQSDTTAATHANGAPVQDIKDWLFLSVVANGNAASCTGACLYNFNVIGAGASGTPIAGLAASGGTSGIVVDNQSTTQVGAEQIYYNTLTGDNAVQASQSNP